MNHERTIHGAAFQMNTCASYMRKWFETDNYQTQQFSFEKEGSVGIMVQIRNTSEGKSSWFKKGLGLATCANLTLLQQGDDLFVSVAAAKWLDKMVVNVLSWFVLWPLFITSGIGMWRQKSLLDKVFIDTLGFFTGSHE